MGHLSWKLPQKKTAIYAIYVCFAIFSCKMYGASILGQHFVLRSSRELRTLSIHRMISLALSGCRKPGSSCVKPSSFKRFPGSFHFENIENQWKHVDFSAKKLSFVELPSRNRKNVKKSSIFQKKQRILRLIIKTHVLAMFHWRLYLNLHVYQQWIMIFHKTCGALLW